MKNDFKQILSYGLGILIVVASLVFLLFISHPYNFFLPLFSAFKSETVLVRNLHDYGFTLFAYRFVIISLAFLIISSLLFFYKVRQSPNNPTLFRIISFSTFIFPLRKLKLQWLLLPSYEKIIIGISFILLLVVRLYLVKTLPITVDEAATYVLFIYKGLLASISYYPIPNNHILYSISCLPFVWLFNNPFWILKLPSILFSLLMFPCMYLSVRSFLRLPGSLCTTIGCSFVYYALYYSVQGRGYILLLFWTFVASIAILKIAEQKGIEYWFWFILASIAGFYTIPVFLYPFSCMLAFATSYFLVSEKLDTILKLITAAFFITLCTILLYLPIILVSGADQLYGNDYVTRLPWQILLQSLPFYLKYTQGAMLGQESIGAYLWLAGVSFLILLLLFERARFIFLNTDLQPIIIFWVLCGAIMPLPFILIQGVLPPERVWVFKLFADFLILGIIFQIIVEYFFYKYSSLIKWVTCSFLLAFSFYQLNKIYRDTQLGMASTKSFEKIADEIKEFGNHQILSTHADYRFHLLLHFLSRDIPFTLDEFNVKPGRNYNVIILDKTLPIPIGIDLTQFYLKHEDSTVLVYFAKK